jgi:uncharacterized membrane protein YadS
VSSTDSNLEAIETAEAENRGWRSEDWLAVFLGLTILISAFLCVWTTVEFSVSDGEVDAVEPDVPPTQTTHPWKPWVGKPGTWEGSNPLHSLSSQDEETGEWNLFDKWRVLVGPFLFALVGFGLVRKIQGESVRQFAPAFLVVFLLGILAYVLAGQVTVKSFNLEYALWALAVGLLISNTVGTPDWLRPAVLTELYIKTGLVLLGAEVLWHRLLALGLPGIFVAWVVTPIVLITTYWFGTKILRVPSRSLNMVISADMSVCGVSAAIATAASCRAKKEELSFAISLSLAFTVVMMVVLPIVIKAIGMDEIVGGAWLGGTIDSTGAVVAAGSALGPEAEQTAATVKMIQNILIGVTAFGVAVYWVLFVERDSSGITPNAGEIWRRFPKFVLGFVFASILFTRLSVGIEGGEDLVNLTVKEATKNLRGWFFCLAFVSIGLESRFHDLRKQIHGGKPLVLYLCGQTLNLVLTLLMAYLMFGVIFADYIREMLAK